MKKILGSVVDGFRNHKNILYGKKGSPWMQKNIS